MGNTRNKRCKRCDQPAKYYAKFCSPRCFYMRDIPIDDETRDGEKWVLISEIPGVFVSSHGRVKHPDGYIVHGHIASHGYRRVGINRRVFDVHRIVAIAFHGNQSKHLHVNHIDGNKLNNRPDNLEWLTQADNNRHAHTTGLVPDPPHYSGESNPSAKLRNKDVIKILMLKGKLTQCKIAKKFKITQSTVSCIHLGKIWKECHSAWLAKEE